MKGLWFYQLILVEPLERETHSLYSINRSSLLSRLLLRSSDHYLHGVISSGSLCGDGKPCCMDDVVKAVAEKIELNEFKPAQLRDLEKELLRIDEVNKSTL